MSKQIEVDNTEYESVPIPQETEEQNTSQDITDQTSTQLEEQYVAPMVNAYLETYAGKPWFQNFKIEEVNTFVEYLREKPGMNFKFGFNEKDKRIEWFYIYYIESGEKTKELFNEVYPDIVKSPIGDQEAPDLEDIQQHMVILNEKLGQEITNGGKYMYVIDAGIIPDKQMYPKTGIQLIRAIAESLDQDPNVNKVFAQTLSEGGMISIMEKTMQARTIDEYPKYKEKKHITAVIDKINFNNIIKRFKRQ